MNPPPERPGLRDAPVSVIVPVRDFARGLKTFAAAWSGQLERMHKEFDLIVVDAGSSDETPAVATELPGAVTLRTEPPHGLGTALRLGVERARHPLVLIIVPEWPYRPADLPALFKSMETADVVAAVRPGKSRPPWLSALGRIARILGRVVFGITPAEPLAWYGGAQWRRWLAWRIKFGLRLQDPECGLRLIRRSVLERCPIQSAGSFALVELAAKANFAGALMAEVPLSKGGDLPVMKTAFESNPADEKVVFRRPKFAPKPAVVEEPVANEKGPAD